MRVLVAPGRFGALTAVEAAEAISSGWQSVAPQVDLVPCVQSDGGRGFLGAVSAARDGAMELLETSDASGSPLSAPVFRSSDGTVYVEAAEWARAEAVGSAASTYPLGAVLAALSDDRNARIVVGLGGLRSLDGGRGLVAALGPTLAAARARLSEATMTVAVDVDRPLLGMQGACASAVEEHGLSSAAAQEAERRMGEWVDLVRRELPAPRDLITGKQQRLDRLPGAGAGGGAGFALAALGADLRSGPHLVASVTRLAKHVAASGLVVAATTVYDWRVLQHSIIEQVALAATGAAVPGVVLAHEIQVGRRETMSQGFSGSYGVLQAGRMRPRGEQPDPARDAAALTALATRVAGTWTPDRP